MKLLPIALAANAGFSLLSGLLLTTFPKYLAGVFAATTHIPFLLIGLGLIFFAYTIFIELKPQRSHKVLAIIIQDLIWVIGSILILIFRPLPIAAIGYSIITWVAGFVLLFALLQAWGWWKSSKVEL